MLSFKTTLGRSILLMLSMVLMTTTLTAADDTSGYLVGTVSDQNNAPLPGALVSVENQDNGLLRDAVVDSRGNFRFPNLPVGAYSLTITLTGFQTQKRSDVQVGIGNKTNLSFTLKAGDVSETMTITHTEDLVDTTSTTSGLNVRTSELVERIPVARDQTSIALLAPGSLEGDNGFNEEEEQGLTIASIGGSSVAENAYLVNGLNTTNFRNGLGGSQVPFEFLEELQIKTGGYQAEFGRSTGGVINTVTKSGSNQFHYGLAAFWEPDSLASEEKDTFERFNTGEEYDVLDANFYASGPIVKDKAFFYVLYNPRDRQISDVRRTRDKLYQSEDAFWGAKLDWYMTPNHHLEITAFSDEQDSDESVFNYSEAGGRLDLNGNAVHQRGGDNYIFKYTGILNPNVFVSAQVGTNDFNRTDRSSGDAFPYVIDSRDGALTEAGLWVTSQPATSSDEREAARLDFDFFVGRHSIRAGVDYEQNTSLEAITYSGDSYFRYFLADGSETFDNGSPNAGDLLVRDRIFRGGGSFETVTTAIYIQDSFALSENFTLNVGFRNETFDNRNAAGNSFIKIDNQLAPRIGFIWDPKGDGTSKLYANFGQYYLPIASNTNIRLSGAEFFTEEWYVAQGINNGDGGDWSPINRGQTLEFTVFGDGEVPDEREIRDTGIKPMFQNEYILGYQTRVGELYTLGARAVHRNLGRGIEDIAVDAALNEYAAREFPNAGFEAGGFDYYVLANPGTDLNFFVDIDGDGVLDDVTLTAEELRYPKAERDYYAMEFTFERQWADNWMLQGSYTWSHSYGNYEGWVRSDNEQDDAGITTNFDQPGLTDHAYGNLPNDRRHNFKIFGAYAFKFGGHVGANLRYRSGRPINAFGVHPTDDFAGDYGPESFFANGQPAPRGSFGTTPSITVFDASFQYPINVGGGNLILRMDVFNLFDFDKVTEVEEEFEQESGALNPNYGLATNYQTPRRVRFSATFRF